MAQNSLQGTQGLELQCEFTYELKSEQIVILNSLTKAQMSLVRIRRSALPTWTSLSIGVYCYTFEYHPIRKSYSKDELLC